MSCACPHLHLADGERCRQLSHESLAALFPERFPASSEPQQRSGKRSCLYRSCALVRGDYHAARRRFRFAQAKGSRCGAFGKQVLAPAQRDREDLQPQFVHQIVCEQRLDEGPAAVDLKFRPLLPLELV